MDLTTVLPSDTKRALRRHRPWLLALLLGVLVFAQTTLAWHEHDTVNAIDSDCDICLQLSSSNAAALSKPELPRFSVASLQAPTPGTLHGSLFTPAPQSRGPPTH